MKMLLTIFLKIPVNVIEVMVVLMVLLALKLVQSGVHHTCGGGDDIVCTPTPYSAGGRGVEPPIKFFKRGA